ncbi:RNA polymerase sigma factor [uncultured Prevotella sp.]|uniref:RNA polymerase sigma factor n=1 Tax=uncultured Prevotella sp. TaxID=159272 RepID=UPI0027E2BB2D|nr:RNA polymerase sigma factor [uncultured Prevotella sp.]
MKRDKVVSIFTHLHQRLHTTARNIAGDDNADDILQDAFCKLWTLKNLPSDQQQTEKIASTIVRNVSIDYKRSAERKTQSSIDKADTENSQDNDIRELFVTVKHIIELQLSDMQRQVLWMRDYEGYSFAEVAEKMCITEENARQILSRARKTIRETYKRIN